MLSRIDERLIELRGLVESDEEIRRAMRDAFQNLQSGHHEQRVREMMRRSGATPEAIQKFSDNLRKAARDDVVKRAPEEIERLYKEALEAIEKGDKDAAETAHFHAGTYMTMLQRGSGVPGATMMKAIHTMDRFDQAIMKMRGR